MVNRLEKFRFPMVVAVLTLFLPGVPTAGADETGSGWLSAWNRKEASRADSGSMARAGAKRLKVEVGAGSLEIQGTRAGTEITYEAKVTAWAKTREQAEELLREVEIREGGKGDSLTLESRGPGNLNHRGFSIDLTIRVPQDLFLDITDGSGSIRIEDVQGGIRIQDGSGEIELKHVGGDTRIKDGSGEIRITDLDVSRGGSGAGKIRITDGSGRIDLDRITGDLDINDGSGDIRIVQLKGSLDLNDGSGSITILGVVGDVEISDGSGNIRLDDVSGNVRLHSVGSGGVNIGKVSGTIHRP